VEEDRVEREMAALASSAQNTVGWYKMDPDHCVR